MRHCHHSSFTSSVMISFSSLNVFKMALLRCLLNLTYGFAHGQFVLPASPPPHPAYGLHFLLSLPVSLFLFLETVHFR